MIQEAKPRVTGNLTGLLTREGSLHPSNLLHSAHRDPWISSVLRVPFIQSCFESMRVAPKWPSLSMISIKKQNLNARRCLNCAYYLRFIPGVLYYPFVPWALRAQSETQNPNLEIFSSCSLFGSSIQFQPCKKVGFGGSGRA